MMAYASRTNTRRNIQALKEAGWGWMVGPLDRGGPILADMPWALDNGAWVAFANGVPWDSEAFLRALDQYGPGADFVVVPDVVAQRDASLRLTEQWLPFLLERADIADVTLLIAVQDDMMPDDVAHLVGDRVGIFVGGSTEWKEGTMQMWGDFCRANDLYLHIGRVNTIRRVKQCAAAEADSFDGTTGTRYAVTIPKIDNARRQGVLFGYHAYA